ncbi:MAG TPA: CBS domain-containing protein [Thermomicrobiales bacterium]|jgi:CBS domain-containing protein|nr:CBS domain-containing protein [Thermomicrobiales bacterium]
MTDLTQPADAVVTDFMTEDFPTLTPEDTVLTAARRLLDSQLPGIPVISGGRMVGLVTEADLIAREAEVETPSSLSILDAWFAPDVGRQFDDEMRRVRATTVADLMTDGVVTVLPVATITDVATVMADRHLNPLPVVDVDGVLLGLVTRRDLIRFVAELDAQDA